MMRVFGWMPLTVLLLAADAPNTPYPLTKDKLDRFLVYQGTMVDLYQRMPKSGGPDDSVAAVQRQAEAQRKAREQSGLPERDVREIERMVSEVMSRRMAFKQTNPDAMIASLEGMAQKVPPEQRAQFQRAIDQAKKTRDAAKDLHEERARYGNANVDLLLSRENDVTKSWTRVLNSFYGG